MATTELAAASNRGLAARQWHRRDLGRVGRATARWKAFTVGLALLSVFILCAIFAPVIARSDPTAVDYERSLAPPSWSLPFGADDQGRNLFSRVIYGTRVSFTIAVVAVGIATAIGVPLGLIAGYFGSWPDTIISRLLDAMFAFPILLMAIAILAITGVGLRGAVIAIGLSAIPEFARVSRSAVITEKENDYVLAARAIGCTTPRLILRQILPNVLGPILVLISLGFAFAILNETALSFLGLGAQSPTPSWGADLAAARRYLFQAPWYAFFPGIAIFCLVLAINLTGDGLQDVSDPRRRRR